VNLEAVLECTWRRCLEAGWRWFSGALGDSIWVHIEIVLGSWAKTVDLAGACWKRQRRTRQEQAGDGRSELAGSMLETVEMVPPRPC